MASTWSALKVELLETGANAGSWGTLTNANLGDAVLGEAITGQATVDFATDADVTITLTDSATTQAARNLRLNITESSSGVGSVRNLILGSGCQIEKFYLINNTGTGAKTIKNTSGTGISVPAGKATLVYNNGTNVVDAASYFTSLTLGSALPVASGGTALTSFTANGVVYASSSSALATGSTLVFDGTNLGLGVTPSAWGGSWRGFEVGALGSSIFAQTSGNNTYVTANAFFNGTNWIRPYASLASNYNQSGGIHSWSTAATGTAGSTISFTQAMTLNASGNLSLGTTTSNAIFTSKASANTYAGGCLALLDSAGSNTSYITSITSSLFFSNNGSTNHMVLDSSGNLLVGGSAARGTTAGTAHLDLFNGTAPAGTLTNGVSLYSSSGDLKFMNAAGDAFDVGYRNIPQNSQSANYTLTLADAGDHIFHPVGDNNARTFTIPANSSVAYPIGTAITFINMAVANVTIAITSDTMYLSSAGTTGSRTLAQYGSATAIKITSTNWLISGSGLT